MKLDYLQFLELEVFTRFGAKLEASMEKAIQRQKALQEELARVAAELQRELENLARGQLTSEQMLEKADQVSELLSQEGSERLQDLLERPQPGSPVLTPHCTCPLALMASRVGPAETNAGSTNRVATPSPIAICPS